jgi:hypothetical protein
LALLVAFVTLPLAGCTTFISSVRRGHNAYHIGNFGVAHKELSKVAKGFSPKAPAAKLDLAMVELVSGDSKVAINRLRDMRDEFDKLDLAAPIGNIASIVADDNARKFRPSGYEQVMIRSMLALGSLATGNGDADAYALQAQMKQQELAEGAERRCMITTTRSGLTNRSASCGPTSPPRRSTSNGAPAASTVPPTTGRSTSSRWSAAARC